MRARALRQLVFGWVPQHPLNPAQPPPKRRPTHLPRRDFCAALRQPPPQPRLVRLGTGGHQEDREAVHAARLERLRALRLQLQQRQLACGVRGKGDKQAELPGSPTRLGHGGGAGCSCRHTQQGRLPAARSAPSLMTAHTSSGVCPVRCVAKGCLNRSTCHSIRRPPATSASNSPAETTTGGGPAAAAACCPPGAAGCTTVPAAPAPVPPPAPSCAPGARAREDSARSSGRPSSSPVVGRGQRTRSRA
jgi:hypothetical protein